MSDLMQRMQPSSPHRLCLTDQTMRGQTIRGTMRHTTSLEPEISMPASPRPSPSYLAIAAAIMALVSTLALAPNAAWAQRAGTDDGAESDSDVEDGLYSCQRARGTVKVSFKPEVELKDLITWAMGFTCRNFVYGASIGGRSARVTIMAPGSMTPQQAWRVFLVALQTMNLTVVPQGNVLRVVESPQAKSEALPLYRRGGPPNSAQLVRMVVRPEHVSSEDLASVLGEFKSAAGEVKALSKVGMVLVTDYGTSISKMRALSREVDQPLAGERLYLLKVRNADATEMASKLQEILGQPDSGRSAPSSSSSSRDRDRNRRNRRNRNRNDENQQTSSRGGETRTNNAVPSKVIADERTNALILVASDAAYRRVRSLVKRLDVAIDGGGTGRIHVYPLEHGDAEEVSNTLNALISGAQQTPSRGGRNTRDRRAPVSSGGGTPAFEGQVRVTHDKPTNALVVVASIKDFFALRDVIERLDVPRRQVFIEAMILEVNTESGLDLGASFHGGDTLDDGSVIVGGLQTPDLQSIFPATLAGSSGLLGGLIGPLLPGAEELIGTSIPSVGILFQAVATSSNVNVLSSPHLLTTDNEEAEISVGQNIPYQSTLGAGIPVTGQTGALPIAPSVQRQDVALTLKITPQINASDMVRLKIDQEISDIASENFGGLGPSWSKRTVKTTVVVRDQQSIVIGGLMADRTTFSETKVPLLGDLPLLGYLFKYTSRSKTKTNLLIVLTPYVIKSQMDIEQILQRKTQESSEFARSFANLSKLEYRPAIDYRRKRGLLEEINRTTQTIDRDIELLRELNQREEEIPDGLIESDVFDDDEPDATDDGGPAPTPVDLSAKRRE